jgi:hypothetical protein
VEQPRAHPVGRRRSRLPRSAPLTTSDARPWTRQRTDGTLARLLRTGCR